MTSSREEVATSDEARRIVLDTYGHLDAAGSSVAEALYPKEALSWLPPQVKELALGVGHPVGYAELRPGETVLDLGCGGGIDTFLAARAVGPEGKAIGLDLTPEMVERAKDHARLVDLPNVEFLAGPMEEVPLPDASVDVIISNGVISMSTQKHKVFWEAWRVLRPGGRIVFGDMPLNGPLPAEIRKHPDALSS